MKESETESELFSSPAKEGFRHYAEALCTKVADEDEAAKALKDTQTIACDEEMEQTVQIQAQSDEDAMSSKTTKTIPGLGNYSASQDSS